MKPGRILELAAALTRKRAQALLAGKANVERKRVQELRDRLRLPLSREDRDLTARDLTRLEGELAKSLDGVSYLRKGPKTTEI